MCYPQFSLHGPRFHFFHFFWESRRPTQCSCLWYPSPLFLLINSILHFKKSYLELLNDLDLSLEYIVKLQREMEGNLLSFINFISLCRNFYFSKTGILWDCSQLLLRKQNLLRAWMIWVNLLLSTVTNYETNISRCILAICSLYYWKN